MLESRVRGNPQARFGGGRSEKGQQRYLAGPLPYSRNQYAHFIVFRERDQRVATTKVTPLPDGTFGALVNAPSRPRFNYAGHVSTLDEAKAAVDERVMAIIAEEYKPEYRPPLG